MIRFDPEMRPSNVRTDRTVAGDHLGFLQGRTPTLNSGAKPPLEVRRFWDDIADVIAASSGTSSGEPRPTEPIEKAVASTLQAAVLRLERPPVVWTGLGFVAGILAGHLIGFWGFVSEIVFNQDSPVEQVASERPTRSVPAVAGYARVAFKADPLYCVSLVLDRATGQTRPAACSGEAEPLRDAGRQRRGNSLVADNLPVENNAWTAATAVDAAPQASGTLELKDFDLEITAETIKR